MKVLKIVGIILLALAALVFILNLLAPKSFDLERSIAINAPPEVIFPHLQYLEKQDAWSPWREHDPEMKTSLAGTDGTVGAVSSWEGNDKVGKGSQEITLVQPYERLETKVRFVEPFQSTADAYFSLKDAGSGATEVAWGFRSPMPFPFNIMGLFMNMEKAVGADYEKGLAKLKALIEEQGTEPLAQFPVQEMELEQERYYLGIRQTVPFSEMAGRIAKNLPEIMAAIRNAQLEVAGPHSGLYFSWDEEKQETDFAVAVPVKSKSMLPGFTTFVYPVGKTLYVDYHGAYEQIGAAHLALDSYMAAQQLKQLSPIVEEYLVGPGEQPDTAQWLTRVLYPVEQ